LNLIEFHVIKTTITNIKAVKSIKTAEIISTPIVKNKLSFVDISKVEVTTSNFKKSSNKKLKTEIININNEKHKDTNFI